jgi:beta-glucosidase
VATAAYQIEGATLIDGRGRCIWDDFTEFPNTIANNDTGKVADDFYHKYKEDVANMKSLGIKHFRMSISWSRVLPKGTIDEVNPLGVDYYNNLFNELLANGITPWVTLFHWDVPSGVHDRTDKGSFLSSDIVPKFNDYADFCFKTFGDRVKNWITLNEPWTHAWNGYGWGVLAPGRCSNDPKCIINGGGGNSSTEPYIVGHYLLLSHAAAYKTYKEKYQNDQKGIIGMTCNNDFAIPWNASDPLDWAASNRTLIF